MARYVSDYCTRDDVEAQLEKANPGTSVPAPVTAQYNDFVTYVDSAIHGASQYISRMTDRVFVPYKDTRNYYFRTFNDINRWFYDRHQGAWILKLGEDLLVTSSVTWDSTLLAATAYAEMPSDESPFATLHFDPDVLLAYGSDFADSVDIVGTWGYHDNISQMYTQIETGITITNSATSLVVASADVYQTWQYLKMEDELLQITARNESTETLTLTRGVNGTTAAAHTSVAISVFNPVTDIRLATTRLAAWAYNNRTDLGTQLTLTDGSTIKNQIPAFVNETIESLQRVSFSVDA